MKKYTLSEYQNRIFSPAARPAIASRPPALNYPFTAAWETAADPTPAGALKSVAAHAAVIRGELAHDDRAAVIARGNDVTL